MKHIAYPSINQFRNTVYDVNHATSYMGKDENDQPIFNYTLVKPTLGFTGAIKIHGCNGAVCYNYNEFWCQSRKQIITPEHDNAGFAFFVEARKDVFLNILNEIKDQNNIDITRSTISLYGEFAGKGIQKGVAIAEIEKSFFIIGIKIVDENDERYWVDCEGYRNPDNRIYNINDYKKYHIDIDFNAPELSQNKIIEYTLEVEEQCPVASEFGIKGLGEGIVFTHRSEGRSYTFKSKGIKHTNSKVKTLKVVDTDKINKLMEIADKVTPPWRLEQFLNEVCDLNNGGMITRDKIPVFMKAVIADIVKEEMDVLKEADIEIKEIGKYISEIAKKYFFEQEKI